jgi:hypothetical protein
MKRCKKCGETKPLSEFHPAAGMRDGHRSECKECSRAIRRAWYNANRDKAIANVKRWQQENRVEYNAKQRVYRSKRRDVEREGHLRRTFGITQADYDALLASQGGGCAICGKPPRKISLHVDHDHETGEIRGLLCVGCNNALGQFHDDAALLDRAISYVARELVPHEDQLEIAGAIRHRARELLEVSG